MPVALNGANEEAVAAFLREQIPFGRIAEIIEAVLDETQPSAVTCIADVHAADAEARRRAKARIAHPN